MLPVAGARLDAVRRLERLDVDGFDSGPSRRRRSDREAGPEGLERWMDERRLPTISSFLIG